MKASAPKGRLPGGDYSFPVVSVGATENAVMAAVLATGQSQLFNAAREPEIADLCNLLVAMGAKIEGIGSSHLIIDGVEGLHGTTYDVMPDRIEAGSYACAAAITGGSLELVGARMDDMRAIFNGLSHAGLILEFGDNSIKVSADGRLKPLALSTSPFPGFPTDMQAQFMAMLALAEGDSFLEETIFENRYMHVPELRRMGAEVDIHGRSAIVHGVTGLTGATVMATDLRASMSLILAGLAAEGRDRSAARLPPRPRLRAAGRKALRRRRHHRAPQRRLVGAGQLALAGQLVHPAVLHHEIDVSPARGCSPADRRRRRRCRRPCRVRSCRSKRFGRAGRRRRPSPI